MPQRQIFSSWPMNCHNALSWYRRVYRGREYVKSSIAKRSIMIGGHKTSISLEDAFWNCLRGIAKERAETVSDLITTINADRQQGNLSSALRLFVLGFYRDQVEKTQDRSSGSSGSVGIPVKSTSEVVAGNGCGFA
jgi:predicted DNA-binding ribbon-helix-helix protein